MDEVITLIQSLVNGGQNLAFARRMADQAFSDHPEAVWEALEELARRRDGIRKLKDPVVVEDVDVIQPWYPGPRPDDRFWHSLRVALVDDGFDAELLTEAGDVGRSSSKILSYLAPPGEAEIHSRGLVVGHVQSGKTTNFTSVVAKGADCGYRLFIVLSGVHDALRTQTQDRLEEFLMNPEVEQSWFNLTHEGDFANPGNALTTLASPNHRSIAVVKKNPARLRRLRRWLESAPAEVIAACPILIVDDEADQASIDVGRTRRSTINRRILDLLDHPKAAYLAYTATPFANLLIDPTAEDLYPKDFVAALPRPEGHMGTEVIFGRLPETDEDNEGDLEGLDLIRHVPTDEISEVRPPTRKADREDWEPSLADSLNTAVLYFALATAARRVRTGKREHSSMLVHTTMFVACQLALRAPVQSALTMLRSEIAAGDTSSLRALWDREQARVPAEGQGEQSVSFDELSAVLGEVVDDIVIVVDNSRSDDRLTYDDDEPTAVIAIGGNTLSRGLTLEGLVVSYFLRSASTYDTLLQMGRWFGFRSGYSDLPRVWMTPDLHQWFMHLATVEHEVREDIERYEALRKTPLELAVRIREHPAMAVTSKAKMRSAVTTRVSYAGSRVQTFLFEHQDSEWLNTNLAATRTLISDATAAGVAPQHRKPGWWILPAVKVELVDRFIDTYNFHERHADLDPERLRSYIAQQNVKGALLTWNVVIAGRASNKVGDINLGLPEDSNLLIRSRLNIEGDGHANIKALMSKVDRVCDLPEHDDTASGLKDHALQNLRPEGIGLLIIYPLDKRSSPTNTPEDTDSAPPPKRVALDAVQDVIGVGLVFPDTRDNTPVTYVAAAVPEEELEELEEELRAEEEEIEAYDLRDEESLEDEEDA